ncbi:MAG TPA: TetR/AcrR family transcriptional regulator, partial [Chloroflexia bacterium]|nr:TetR/AcrR family transcriptional regulator [Chloroflexia bacterium]
YIGASVVDPEAAAELKQALAGRRAGLDHFIATSAGILRQDLSTEKASAIFRALTHEQIYKELVEVGGWSPDHYEAWLAEILKKQLLG